MSSAAKEFEYACACDTHRFDAEMSRL
jgi:hypothetical protein